MFNSSSSWLFESKPFSKEKKGLKWTRKHFFPCSIDMLCVFKAHGCNSKQSNVQLPWLVLRFFMSRCVFSLAFKYSPLFKHITYIFLCIYFLGNLKSLGLLEIYKVVINSELLLFEALIASPMDAPSKGAIALSCNLVENPIQLVLFSSKLQRRPNSSHYLSSCKLIPQPLQFGNQIRCYQPCLLTYSHPRFSMRTINSSLSHYMYLYPFLLTTEPKNASTSHSSRSLGTFRHFGHQP